MLQTRVKVTQMMRRSHTHNDAEDKGLSRLEVEDEGLCRAKLARQ